MGTGPWRRAESESTESMSWMLSSPFTVVLPKPNLDYEVDWLVPAVWHDTCKYIVLRFLVHMTAVDLDAMVLEGCI